MSRQTVYECRSGRPPRIGRVDIAIMSPDEIRRLSVVEVTEAAIYEKNMVKRNGINDHRMGSVDRRVLCGTCRNAVDKCPGHIGHIELQHPLYLVGYLQHVLKTLKSVCYYCSRCLVKPRDDPGCPPPTPASITPEASDASAAPKATSSRARTKLGAVSTHAKVTKACPFCEGPQPKYVIPRDNALSIETDWKGTHFDSEEERAAVTRKSFTARDAHSILLHVPDEDYEYMGFSPRVSHPSWMIMTVLVVPPPIIRPSRTESEGSRSRGQDDLTIKLKNIVSANNALRNFYKKRQKRLESLAALQGVLPSDLADLIDLEVDSDAFHALPLGLDGDGTSVSGSTAAGGKKAEKTEKELVAALQYEVATYHNNDIRGVAKHTQRSGAATKCIFRRLKGKEGRVRGNLMGKRVDFTARAVITPDPNLEIYEVGVPVPIALEHTYSERVTNLNIDELTERVRIGPSSVYGAKCIIDTTSKAIHLDHKKPLPKHEVPRLQVGWSVVRPLKDGEPVAVNRQPSLHKASMMGHLARIYPTGNTIRLPLEVTPSYNADFDGDEMNLHRPQSALAAAEVKEIMIVPKQLVGPQSNKPLMSLVMDALPAVQALTKRNSFVDRCAMMDLIMQMRHDAPGKTSRFVLPTPAILKYPPPRDGRAYSGPLWTGKQVFSMVLPAALTLRKNVRDWDVEQPPDHMDPSERCVLIERGELLCGSICKATAGNSAGGIVHVIWKDIGAWEAAHFLGDARRVANRWLSAQGFSVGLDDCTSTSTAKGMVDEAMRVAVQRIKEVRKAARWTAETAPDKAGALVVPERELKGYLARLGNRITDQVGRIVQRTTPDENTIQRMVVAGSKGNHFHMTQLRGGLGQQCNEGEPIRPEWEWRTLPCYRHCDPCPEPEMNGMIWNSFERGLSPQEMFLHHIGGREGLIDTAVKTAETGYTQRRLVKSMESHQVMFSMVRNVTGEVIQFCYGGDGMDACFVEKIRYPLYDRSNEGVRAWLDWGAADETEEEVLRREVARNVWYRDQVRAMKEFVPAHAASANGDVFVVDNPARMLERVCQPYLRDRYSPGNIVTPAKVWEDTEELLRQIEYSEPMQSPSAPHRPSRVRSTTAYRAVVAAELCCRNIIRKWKCTEGTWKEVLEEVKARFDKSVVCSGEMVGSLAGQSIGEPGTQMTLRTFHFAGCVAKNVTLGIPRLKEIVDATTKMKKSSATVYLREPHSDSEAGALEVCRSIESVLLGTVLKGGEVVDLCDRSSPYADPDAGLCEEFLLTENSFARPTPSSAHSSPLAECLRRRYAWAVKYELDRSAMTAKDIGPTVVADAVRCVLGERGAVWCSEHNMPRWLVYVVLYDVPALISQQLRKDVPLPVGRDLEVLEKTVYERVDHDLRAKIRIGGVAGITKAVPTCVSRFDFDRDTGERRETKEWVLDTEGTALMALLGLAEVDCTRTFSNNVHEVNSVLGIEAAVGILFHEIKTVISFDGTYVNDRHFLVAVDTMTYRGRLLAMSRNGINKIDNGFLGRSTFEKTTEILLEAAAFAERNPITRGAVTESIMLGQTAPIGTGNVDVLMDAEYADMWAPPAASDKQPVPLRRGARHRGRDHRPRRVVKTQVREALPGQEGEEGKSRWGEVGPSAPPGEDGGDQIDSDQCILDFISIDPVEVGDPRFSPVRVNLSEDDETNQRESAPGSRKRGGDQGQADAEAAAKRRRRAAPPSPSMFDDPQHYDDCGSFVVDTIPITSAASREPDFDKDAIVAFLQGFKDQAALKEMIDTMDDNAQVPAPVMGGQNDNPSMKPKSSPACSRRPA